MNNTKIPSEVCECGHKKEEHNSENRECLHKIYENGKYMICLCKKFTPQKQIENHSQQTKPILSEDDLTELSVSECNLKDKTADTLRGSGDEICECGHEKSLHILQPEIRGQQVCLFNCPCKKFQPQKQIENHSQQGYHKNHVFLPTGSPSGDKTPLNEKIIEEVLKEISKDYGGVRLRQAVRKAIQLTLSLSSQSKDKWLKEVLQEIDKEIVYWNGESVIIAELKLIKQLLKKEAGEELI